tara:strand:- start:252 stop:803 length:552 start_codon:yes stop_codon:yes gene_type:complete
MKDDILDRIYNINVVDSEPNLFNPKLLFIEFVFIIIIIYLFSILHYRLTNILDIYTCKNNLLQVILFRNEPFINNISYCLKEFTPDILNKYKKYKKNELNNNIKEKEKDYNNSKNQHETEMTNKLNKLNDLSKVEGANIYLRNHILNIIKSKKNQLKVGLRKLSTYERERDLDYNDDFYKGRL